MPFQTISDLLASDTTSPYTAAQIFSLGSTKQQAKWVTSAGVPPYLFTPLKTIFMPAGSTTPQFVASIVPIYGLGNTPAMRSIQIVTLPKEANEVAESANDTTGAETALLKIITEIHPDVQNVDAQTLKQSQLRIRYLIDQLWRNKRFLMDRKLGASPSNWTQPQLPSTDMTIDPEQPFLCGWGGMLSYESTMAMSSIYGLKYTRVIVPMFIS